jgi:hypothetical protein
VRRAAIVPGDDSSSSGGGATGLWRALEAAGGGGAESAATAALNVGQTAALAGLREGVTLVQGPPATGKSALIAAVAARRMPRGARLLVCTATHRAVDALVSAMEAAGVAEVLAVGCKAMGARARRYVLSERLARDAALVSAEALLDVRSEARRACEAAAAELRKLPKKKKGGKGDAPEDNVPLFVSRQAERLA